MDHDAFSRRVREVVYATYRRINHGGKPQAHEWTVLAAILAERDGEIEVVTMATGTKCVGEAQMSDKGLVVNDCHAEVLCRRAFLFFLMNEVKQFQSTGKSLYLEKVEDSNKLRVRESVQFHLYISQTPCGLASEYAKAGSKREAVECFAAKQRKSKRLCLESTVADQADQSKKEEEMRVSDAKCVSEKRSCLKEERADSLEVHHSTEKRTDSVEMHHSTEKRADSVEMHLSGAKFVDDGMRLSTKPGRGEHSRSYSCSDKICLWNLLGVQGALLSLVLNPVYLASIVISGEMDEAVVAYALRDRVKAPQLAAPFRQNTPVIVRDVEASPLCEREVMKTLEGKRLAACGSAVVWIAPGAQETLIARSGVKLGANVKKGITEKTMSLLCPLSLFRQFKECARGVVDPNLCAGDYASVKENSREYCKMKDRVMDAAVPCSLKAWRKKDRAYYHFQFTVCNKHPTRHS